MAESAQLPAGWEWTTLGAVTRIVGGSTPKSAVPSYWDGGIAWLAVSDMTEHREKFIRRGARNITQAGYDACSTQLLPAGSVVMSSRAPIGYVAIAANELCTSQGFKSFVPEEGLVSDYLFWYLRASKSLAESFASGTTFKELSARAAERVPIPLPPKAEQERIVETLETIFNQIEEAASDVEQALVGAPSLREAYLMAVTRDLERQNLGDLVSEMRYGTSVRSDYTAAGPPVLRIPNVRGGSIDREDLKFSTAPESQLGDAFVKEGDLLFVRTNGSRDLIGKVAAVNAESDGSAFASYLIRARPDPRRLDPQWAVIALSTLEVREAVHAKAASTAGQYNLNLASLRSLSIAAPPVDEQRRLVIDATRTTEEIRLIADELGASLRSVDQLKASVLNRAFTGGLVPQDPSEQPAKAILDAISADRLTRSQKQAKRTRAGASR